MTNSEGVKLTLDATTLERVEDKEVHYHRDLHYYTGYE